MKKFRNKTLQKGFTLVELLIATAVFSIVLIVFLAAFLRISQLFYKGVNMARTQETARNVIQSISDDVQFYQQPPVIKTGYFCVGIHRYKYFIGQQVDSTHSGIVREDVGSGCPALDTNGTNSQEMLDPGMQVNKLFPPTCVSDRCNMSVRIVFYGGDNSVLVSPSGVSPAWKAPDAQCSGSVGGTQYCAVADYSSTVLQRF